MRAYILLLSIILMAGCVSSTQNTSTSTSAKSISSHTGINGMWKGTFKYGREHLRVTLEFNQNGDTFTGIIKWAKTSTPLLNGKITGNKITFQTQVKDKNGTTTGYYEGTVDNDLIRLKSLFNTPVGSSKIEANFRRVN